MTFLLLLLAHLTADFVLQGSAMANTKLNSRVVLLKHCLIYSAAILTVVIFYGSALQVVVLVTCIALSHFVVDSIRIWLQKRCLNSEKREFRRFAIDQFTHIAILVVASFFMQNMNFIGLFMSDIIYTYLSINFFAIIVVTTAYVICFHPSGVFVKKVFIRLGYQKLDAEDDNINGFIIGVLERICILTLAIFGQFTAISFVIAAKSLARIKLLEDKDFAEKYLIGTLISVIIALVCGIAVQKILNI